MHHRKSTSDGSQRSPGAPGGSPNLPFLWAYARTARNSEVVISFESSTLGKGKGVQVKKSGKQLSALAFDPSVPCTFSRGMYNCLQTWTQAWLEPANELKEEPLLRPEVCFDFKDTWECMTRSEGFISAGNSPRLSETWCSWSTDEFWNKNVSVKHIAACSDLRPKNLSFLLIRVLWSLGLGTSKVIMQSSFAIFKNNLPCSFFFGSFSFWLSFITNSFVSFISITLVCSPCVLSSIEVYCLKFSSSLST